MERSRKKWAQLYVQSCVRPNSVSKDDKRRAEKEVLKWLVPNDDKFMRLVIKFEGEMYYVVIHHNNHYPSGEQCFLCGVHLVDKMI